MGLRIANRPVLDAAGFARAVVVRSEFGEGQETVRRGKDEVEPVTYQRFELELQADGTTGPIKMEVFTGTVLNGPIGEKGRGKAKKPTYNRLTGLCLALGLVQAGELDGEISDDVRGRIEAALLNLEGDRLKFQLGRVEGRPLPVPVLESFTRDDTPAPVASDAEPNTETPEKATPKRK
jgi:hypothetical protein